MNIYKINSVTNALLAIGEVEFLDQYSDKYFLYQPKAFLYKPLKDKEEINWCNPTTYQPGFWIVREGAEVRVQLNLFLPDYKEIPSFVDHEKVIGLVKYNRQRVYYDQYITP